MADIYYWEEFCPFMRISFFNIADVFCVALLKGKTKKKKQTVTPMALHTRQYCIANQRVARVHGFITDVRHCGSAPLDIRDVAS